MVVGEDVKLGLMEARVRDVSSWWAGAVCVLRCECIWEGMAWGGGHHSWQGGSRGGLRLSRGNDLSADAPSAVGEPTGCGSKGVGGVVVCGHKICSWQASVMSFSK